MKKTMKKMGYDFTIDEDGDIKYKMDDTGWTVYVIFDETSSGKLWNLQMLAQFSTKKSRYDELVEYANTWNTKKKFPKVTMKDRDSLKLTMDFPIQYGFNPDEFEDNVIGMFERTVKKIADETDAMRN
ncbi:MAG: YbjN domain-containing protein [Gammaproteobacteria bacterium]|nr:YbjN domain-containing protein [Gammaproteobacteria bacterium]